MARFTHAAVESRAMLFQNRRQAGRRLAGDLARYAGPNTVVLALPRGGVPVGYEIARALHVPLDVFVVRKLGVPGHEELAMGAIADGGVAVMNDEVVNQLDIRSDVVGDVARNEKRELERRASAYRGNRRPLDVAGKTVILADDGLATGASMRAAVQALRALGPARLVVAVPVAAEETCDELRQLADDVVCAVTPDPFLAVGVWYKDFSQTTDTEVRELLDAAAEPAARSPRATGV